MPSGSCPWSRAARASHARSGPLHRPLEVHLPAGTEGLAAAGRIPREHGYRWNPKPLAEAREILVQLPPTTSSGSLPPAVSRGNNGLILPTDIGRCSPIAYLPT